MPLWGQAWSLDVTYTPQGGGEPRTMSITCDQWQPEALRMTFEVLQAAYRSPIWYADISVYNLDSQTIQDILVGINLRVVLKAGFQSGPNISSIIWNGPVFQVLYTREAVVDQKLTLHCIATPPGSDITLNFSMGQGFSQQKLLASIARFTNLPPISVGQGTLGQTAEKITSAVTYPRGNTVFGKPAAVTAQIADSNSLQSFTDGVQMYVTEADTGSRTPTLIYAPPFPPEYSYIGSDVPDGTTHSLVGTPQQTPEGVIFTVLLDPRLRVGLPPQLAQLVRTQLNAQQLTPSADSDLPSLQGPDGTNLLFFVKQIRHTGDTRGNDWTTEVTGWSTAYAQTLLGTLGT